LQYSGWSDANHVKDLIRPLFIFVVGVAMPYSFGKRLSLGDSKRKVYGHVLKRAAILFLLGTIAGGHLLALDRSKFYLANNVLEEIAIGYLVASLFRLSFSVRGQLIALAAMLLGYWALIVLVPVPGHGAGIITPEVNLPRYVDDLVLGGLRPVKWSFTWTLSPTAPTNNTHDPVNMGIPEVSLFLCGHRQQFDRRVHGGAPV
jgi:predicted acyltransferase